MSKFHVELAISEESKEEKTHFTDYSADDIENVEEKEFNKFFESLKGKLLYFQEIGYQVLHFLLGSKLRTINPTEMGMYEKILEGPSPYLYLGE